MGMLERLATKKMAATVQKSLTKASPEQLVQHWNKLQEIHRTTSDLSTLAELAKLKEDILAELKRRGENILPF